MHDHTALLKLVTRQILESQESLRVLNKIHKLLSSLLLNVQYQSDDFAKLLSDIYNSLDIDELYYKDSFRELLRFILRELQNASKHW